jgi:two-component system sensor histidine kinase/response regulator
MLGKNMRILNILVAEDDDQNQAMMKLLLSRHGHKVNSAWNGLQAFEAVKTGTYDLVFMDVHMPEMDGLETTRQIRKWENNEKHVPIVILTGSVSENITNEYKLAGADTFITKPFEVKKINLLLNIIADQAETHLEQESQLYSNDTLAGAAILDIQSALIRFNGDYKLYLENLKEFLQTLPDRLQRLKHALKINDWQELSLQAHNLKGVAANFGANQLSMLAFQLDEFSRRHQVEQSTITYSEIDMNILTVLEMGDKIIKQGSPDHPNLPGGN